MGNQVYTIEKQPQERYPITVDCSSVLEDGEDIVFVGSDVSCVDNAGNSCTIVMIDETSIAVALSGKGLKARIRGGVLNESPYHITFRMATSDDNLYEQDFKLTIKER